MLITKSSKASVANTVQEIKSNLQVKGINIFAEIDHAKAARESNLELRDEVLVIFGNPKVGTYLMQEKPSIGIDLPMKLLIWQDLDGKTQMSYFDPIKMGEHHGIQQHIPILQNMSALLDNITTLKD